MKDKKKILPKSRSGLWILIVAAVILEGTACVQYFYTRHVLEKAAEENAQKELRRAELEIRTHTIEMETAAQMLAMLAEKHVDCPDSIFAATRSIVGALENTSSVAVAYVPGYFKGKPFFEACSSRISEDSIYTRQIGSAEHDYTQMEWFQNGLRIDSCWWCEPYLDDSGSRTFVVSCSHPVRNSKGDVVAVVCVDLSLGYLQNMSEYLQVYEGSFYSITSESGETIVPIGDTIPGRKYRTFDREIDDTGWHIAIVIPDDVIYADLRRVGLIVSLMMLLGLMVLLFIIYRAAQNLIRVVNLSNRQERMESELNIARGIQMAMLPTRFPPFDDVPNLSAYGVVIPAKEVGGDLFDFYLRENKLFFCIGDVSGKGVPASLVMAMTRSLFRSFTSYLDSPAQVVTQMNNSLSGEGNDQNMFVTLFLGILELNTGKLRYCNAGHDEPIKVESQKSKVESIPCKANLPLGVMADYPYEEQMTQLAVGDTLFLYTDGLTEAEDSNHALFGLERITERLQTTSDGLQEPRTMIADMQEAVHAFVGQAQQSDDLTMFAVRFNSKRLTPTNHHSLVMRNDIQQIPTLAEWIDSLDLPQELNMPINLALEEAVSNVMLYAYPGSSGQVLVEAEHSAEQITFTISDSGIPFDPTAQTEPDLTLSAEERPIGGLGIHLVRQIMDSIHYERKDNRNILTLTKKL
ncbi:MAG: SpoIIE family protein phosphatase [Paludibacteraceae bacterium]|nr:SpoIIE family protein phosphatase [Paludibacteraceae bacterium]